MRTPRIKAQKGEDGLYHCMSRIVSGDYIFGAKEKEVFCAMMWRLADFLSIEILDYVVMSNHYHQLVEVPGVIELSDKQLLQRVSNYYGPLSLKAIQLEKVLAKGGEAADTLRSKYHKRIGNISEYEKILKQGFSRWYNKQNKRRGTLWMERFKSLLVEDTLEARQIISTYIDLNPVRAEMVEDPKDYRHCGYAAALVGDKRCQKGIMRIMGTDDWNEAARAYRKLIMRRGHKQIIDKSGFISRELLLKTLQEKGKLSKSELLRLRIRHFSDGLVLGSEAFVEKIFLQHRSHFGEKRKSGARPIQALESAGLNVIRNLQKTAIS